MTLPGVLLSTGLVAEALLAQAFTVSQNEYAAVGAIVFGVGLIAGFFKWVDSRIKTQVETLRIASEKQIAALEARTKDKLEAHNALIVHKLESQDKIAELNQKLTSTTAAANQTLIMAKLDGFTDKFESMRGTLIERRKTPRE